MSSAEILAASMCVAFVVGFATCAVVMLALWPSKPKKRKNTSPDNWPWA